MYPPTQGPILPPHPIPNNASKKKTKREGYFLNLADTKRCNGLGLVIWKLWLKPDAVGLENSQRQCDQNLNTNNRI